MKDIFGLFIGQKWLVATRFLMIYGDQTRIRTSLHCRRNIFQSDLSKKKFNIKDLSDLVSMQVNVGFWCFLLKI